MGIDNRNTVFEDDIWSIELRPRNNVHPGEPAFKVWVYMMGKEVAKYSDKYRGYGPYSDNEALIDPAIALAARKTWDRLTELVPQGEFTPEMGDALRTEISEFVKTSREAAPAVED